MTRPAQLKTLAIPATLLAVAFSTLAIAACGESAAEKAKAQVCGARSDISKQVATLTTLTPSVASLPQAKTGIEAIGSDINKIRAAQPNLDPSRKQQVQSANEAFATSVTSIARGLASNLSLSSAEAQLKTAVSQLTASYKSTLAPISCS